MLTTKPPPRSKDDIFNLFKNIFSCKAHYLDVISVFVGKSPKNNQ